MEYRNDPAIVTSAVIRSEELSGFIRPRYCAKSMVRVEEHTRDGRKTRNELPRLRGLPFWPVKKGQVGCLVKPPNMYNIHIHMYLRMYISLVLSYR